MDTGDVATVVFRSIPFRPSYVSPKRLSLAKVSTSLLLPLTVRIEWLYYTGGIWGNLLERKAYDWREVDTEDLLL
jgi:hypothetical protein